MARSDSSPLPSFNLHLGELLLCRTLLLREHQRFDSLFVYLRFPLLGDISYSPQKLFFFFFDILGSGDSFSRPLLNLRDDRRDPF